MQVKVAKAKKILWQEASRGSREEREIILSADGLDLEK